jgi:hypothetical protein
MTEFTRGAATHLVIDRAFDREAPAGAYSFGYASARLAPLPRVGLAWDFVMPRLHTLLTHWERFARVGEALLAARGWPAVNVVRVLRDRFVARLCAVVDVVDRFVAIYRGEPVVIHGQREWIARAIEMVVARAGGSVRSTAPKVAQVRRTASVLARFLALRPMRRPRIAAQGLAFVANIRHRAPLVETLLRDGRRWLCVEEYVVPSVEQPLVGAALRTWSAGNDWRLSRDLMDAFVVVREAVTQSSIELDSPSFRWGEFADVLFAEEWFYWITRVAGVLGALESLPSAPIVGLPVTEWAVDIARRARRHCLIVQSMSAAEYEMHIAGSGTYGLWNEREIAELERFWPDSSRKTIVIGRLSERVPSEPLRGERTLLCVDATTIAGLVDASHREAFVDGCVRAALRVGAALHMRMHPFACDEDRALVTRVIAARIRWEDVSNLPLAECLRTAHVVAMVHSNVGIDAVDADRPIVDFSYTRTDHFGFFESGAALLARSRDELERMLVDAFCDPSTVVALSDARARERARSGPRGEEARQRWLAVVRDHAQ